MAIQIGIIGAFTIDNVINADGKVAIYQCGGNAFYGAAGARLWTSGVGVVARIGRDYPRHWVSKLADSGVDVSGVREISGEHVLHGGMKYDSNGARENFTPHSTFTARGLRVPEGMVSDFPASDPEIEMIGQTTLAPDPEDIPESFLQAKAFHFAPRYYQKHIASLAMINAHGILTILDPGIWYMRERDETKLSTLLRYVDVFIPSELEARAFYGSEVSLREIAKSLAGLGPKVVVIKAGSAGSLVYDRVADRFFHLPIYPSDVVDPTGAGDSYCGGFTAGYLETNDAFMAAAYGTVSASFVVEGFGADYALQFTTEQAYQRLEIVKDLEKSKVRRN